MCEMSKHSMRFGNSGRLRTSCSSSDRFGVGLEHAETLIVGLLGIRAGKVDEGTLIAALWDQDVNARGAGIGSSDLLGEQVFERRTIFEIDRHIEIARDIGLTDVELLEEGREKLSGMEGICSGRSGRISLSWIAEVGCLRMFNGGLCGRWDLELR